MFRKFLSILLFLVLFSSSSAAERVVSLYGSYAEAWLEAGGTLVGVTDDAIHERHLETDAAIIGTNKAPHLELILSLQPDWVILSADIAAQQAIQEVLEGAGIACSAFRVDTWQDYAKMMDVFTQRTGRRDIYNHQVLPMADDIRSIIDEARTHEPVEVLLLRAYSTGVKAKGADNLAGVMLQDLGCVNLADKHPSLLEELSLESIIAEDPDWIFVSVMGGDEAAAQQALNATLLSNPAFASLTAVQEGHLHILPRDLFHYKPNARWRESYAYLCDLLW